MQDLMDNLHKDVGLLNIGGSRSSYNFNQRQYHLMLKALESCCRKNTLEAN